MEKNKETNNKNDNSKKQNKHKERNDYSINTKKLLGKGSFGKIYAGINKTTGEEIAIKVESLKAEQPQLIYEYKIYKYLQNGFGIPKVYECSKNKKYIILIMDLLGDSLEKKFNECDRHFSLLTVLMIMEQLVSRIEFVHSKNLLHRDIKPDNFLVGRGNKRNIIYAIDFGLSKRYRDPKTGLHIEYRDGKSLTGTARYASINTHLGMEQSRRDDIEALGYMMVYFLKGSLPWQGMVINDPKKKYDKIKQIKYNIKLEELCKGLPKQCIDFIQYARDMKFADRPDYHYLRELLRKAAKENGLFFDSQKFDWIIKEDNEKNKKEEDIKIEKEEQMKNEKEEINIDDLEDENKNDENEKKIDEQ
jgi:serine/threonine protein kinase